MTDSTPRNAETPSTYFPIPGMLQVAFINDSGGAASIPALFHDRLLTGTTEFMRLGGQLANPEFDPQWEADSRKLRRNLINEEITEYFDGEDQGNLVEIVDGLLDIIVIAWGTLLAYVGEDKANAAAAEVVRSNLSKVDGSLGPIVRREDGKLLKPEGWTPPDIKGAIE